MATVTEIHVLSRKNYQDQHIVTVPYTPSPLPASSIRVKSAILSLTVNNLTYARMGHLVGWWDVHPLPENIPEQFSDPKEFGRISAWGFGIITESTISSLTPGTQVFGYLPIGTLPIDMQVKIDDEISSKLMETSQHRSRLWPLYNRYLTYPPSTIHTQDQKDSVGWDAILMPLFEPAYLMNRCVFPSKDDELIAPSSGVKDWNLEKGSFDGNTVILCFGGSGKTGLLFAHQLKNGRTAEKKPRLLVCVGSATSKTFTEGTGLYDMVLTYDDDSGNLDTLLGLSSDSKIVIVDFGSRGGAGDRWAQKLEDTHTNFFHVTVGGEVAAISPEEVTAKFLSRSTKKIQVNATDMRDAAIEALGEKRFMEEYEEAWNEFKKSGGVNGLKLSWGEGMKDFEKAWARLCNGEVGADKGLVFQL